MSDSFASASSAVQKVYESDTCTEAKQENMERNIVIAIIFLSFFSFVILLLWLVWRWYSKTVAAVEAGE